jgi:hypothetical protein
MTTPAHVTVCPFIEKNIQQDHLPFQFTNLIEKELKEQRKQIASNTRKYIQIDLNKLYHWNSNMSQHSYSVLRRVVLGGSDVNPVLEQDIKTDNTTILLALANAEYKYQEDLVRRGLKKSINVDLNLLYC